MIKRYCLYFLVALALCLPVQADTVYTVYLIRHAEKSKTPQDDPVLTPQGVHRAGHVADMLAATKIKKVYSSPYQRTRQTAQPVAERHQVNIIDYDPRQLPILAEKLKKAGENALVVGHSNTTPQLLNILTGLNYPDMSHTDYDTVFQVTFFSDDQWQLQILKSLPVGNGQ